MVLSTNEQKKRYQVNVRLILGLIAVLFFFTIILITSMLSVSKSVYKKAGSKNNNSQGNQSTASPEDMDKTDFIGVVKMIDTKNQKVTLYDIFSRKELTINYNGASNITDEYGQVIAVSQIDAGNMVDVSYKKDSNKITDMSISDQAWEYVGVNNFTLDISSRIMKIAKNQYKLADNVTILDGTDFVSINDIAEQDVLTVWGYEETIWSIAVTRGHGYVILQDYQEFLGDQITIGYEAMQQITENMMITVREGEYNLTVENGDFSATKKVKINRNEITYVSLSDFGPLAPKYGNVQFEINPFGAELFINGDLTSYSSEIELKYGKYPIKVSLGGYVTYEGELNVDSPAKTIKINLPETSSSDKVEVSEINTQDNAKDGKQDNSDTGLQDENQDNIFDNDDESGSTEDSSGYITDGDNIIDTKHKIYIQRPTGVSVYLDGDFMGISPVSFEKVMGSHVITLIKEGCETQSHIIDVINDKKDAYYKFDNLPLISLMTPDPDE